MKYRSSHRIVEAFQYGFDPDPDWFTALRLHKKVKILGGGAVQINSVGVVQVAEHGDWITIDRNEIIVSFKPQIFSVLFTYADKEYRNRYVQLQNDRMVIAEIRAEWEEFQAFMSSPKVVDVLNRKEGGS